jgi:hypothetical protein
MSKLEKEKTRKKSGRKDEREKAPFIRKKKVYSFKHRRCLGFER